MLGPWKQAACLKVAGRSGVKMGISESTSRHFHVLMRTSMWIQSRIYAAGNGFRFHSAQSPKLW
jgi:hypothetical protein